MNPLVSNVVDMSWMFHRNHSFNQDISSWNTGKVEDMSYMFNSAHAFIGVGIGQWDVSHVYTFQYMFTCAINFNSPLSNWDVRNVRNAMFMFECANSFEQDLSMWELHDCSTDFMFLACPVMGKILHYYNIELPFDLPPSHAYHNWFGTSNRNIRHKKKAQLIMMAHLILMDDTT